jgi:hypothetical protein
MLPSLNFVWAWLKIKDETANLEESEETTETQ